jgi:hypothetical protein
MASRASALATGCSVEISDMGQPVYELRQNKALGSTHPFDDFCTERTSVLWRVAETFARVFRCKTGPVDYEWGISSASTDFVGFLRRII